MVNTPLLVRTRLRICAGHPHFLAFCRQLAAQGVLESELVSGRHGIRAEDLAIGSLIRIAWLPDRECTLRYLGERQFEAVETQHAKLQPGDTSAMTAKSTNNTEWVPNTA